MRTRYALPALVAVAALMLSGCADNSVPVAGGSTGSASASDVKKDDAAAALLPDKIAKSGKLVIATSPTLQGEQSAVTDKTGAFRIQALPPGDYKLSAQF